MARQPEQLEALPKLVRRARTVLAGNGWVFKDPASWPASTGLFAASDEVLLGNTGIRTSRLAMGTGTRAKNQHSMQTSLGSNGLVQLLMNGYEKGLRFFDTADSYGSHAHIATVLKQVPRERVTLMTKTYARDAATMRADLDRFRVELGTDYIDICLMHCLRERDWTERFPGAMDALSEAKERGIVRAHGCSCHGIGALRTAAETPWVEISLVRLNPIQSHMDASPSVVLEIIRKMRSAGKGIVGMKILGEGDLRGHEDAALHFALSSGVLDAFTIGAETIQEQDDLIRRIGSLPWIGARGR